MYIWQNEHWPHMIWQSDQLSLLLAEVNALRGKLAGRLSMFGMAEQNLSVLNSMTKEIVNSAGIEGETLNRDSVRSSVAHQLGLEYDGLPKSDHYIEGVVQVMIDATQHYQEAISAERLFCWHRALFPYGHSGMYKIRVGAWREGNEPMQVVSGAMGKQKVHYEAPPSNKVEGMMDQLLEWINEQQSTIDPLVKAAVAHLWFVTIHPFDDGNGRLCRTLTEMLLSRADGTPKRFYSLSSEILNKRNGYYNILWYGKDAKKATKDVPFASMACVPCLLFIYVGLAMVTGGVLPHDEVAGAPTILPAAQAILPGAVYKIFMIGGPIMAIITTLNLSLIHI